MYLVQQVNTTKTAFARLVHQVQHPTLVQPVAHVQMDLYGHHLNHSVHVLIPNILMAVAHASICLPTQPKQPVDSRAMQITIKTQPVQLAHHAEQMHLPQQALHHPVHAIVQMVPHGPAMVVC